MKGLFNTRITSLQAYVANLSVCFVSSLFDCGDIGTRAKETDEGRGERTLLSPLLPPLFRFFDLVPFSARSNSEKNTLTKAH